MPRGVAKGLTPMIKSVGLLTRKGGLTHEDFVKHWFEVHAPLAHAVPGVRRYVQSHIVEERRRPDIQTTDVEIEASPSSGTTTGPPWNAPMRRPRPSACMPMVRCSSAGSR